MTKKRSDTSIFKIILIFAVVFVIIPFAILVLVYFTNSSFKEWTNNNLKSSPGFIGEHFKKYPTQEERNDKEKYLADYYINLDKERAADKLYIIMKSDEELYNNIVRRMNSISSSRTHEIIRLIRNIDVRKDLLFSIYDEILDEKSTNLQNEVKRIEALDTYIAIKEFEESINGSSDSLREIVDVVALMNETKIAEILHYLEKDSRDKVLTRLAKDKRRTIDRILLEKQLNNEKLMDLAKVYEVKDIQKSFEEIGNTDTYNINDLSKIYLNLSVKKAAEILSLSQNEEFVKDLYDSIRREERLLGLTDSVVVNISRTVNYFNEYNDKINNLVSLYERMNPAEVAKIVESMLNNQKTVSAFEIEYNAYHNLSDSDIIMDVIRKMRKNKLSDILRYLDTTKSAEITRKLAID